MFFHCTSDQRFFTYGILLGVGGILGTLLCANSLINRFIGGPNNNNYYGLIAIKVRLYKFSSCRVV